MRKLLLGLFIAGLAVAQVRDMNLQVSMVSLGVIDMAKAVSFYRDTLGMELAGPVGEVTVVKAGGVSLALNHPLATAAGDAIVGATEVIFQVDHVEAAHAKLAERGCQFIREPRELFPGTWGATFTDPDGHRLTIMGPR